MTARADILRIHEDDNVVVALGDLDAGRTLRVGAIDVTTAEPIPRGHKIALTDIAESAPVVKYGCPIGRATRSIAAGEHVHTHNLASGLDDASAPRFAPMGETARPATGKATFDGFVRDDGRVGTRNEVWILPTVGCVNKIAECLAAQADPLAQAAGVDGVYAFTHPLGCSQLGDDHRRTQTLLADLARHPNAGAVLVVGLGCENNNIEAFQAVLGPVDPARVAFLQCQAVDDEIAAGLAMLRRLIDHAGRARREPVGLDRLCVGLKCGGSDGLSGVTANPLVGAVTDRLTAAGTAAILTEVPEMFGAEPLLARRAVSDEIYQAAMAMIADFKAYFRRYDQPIDKNPSPGNLAGGITTLEEKSLGCVQKAGRSPVVDVLHAGQHATKPGVSLLDGPGNDMVAVTNLAAAGATMILFTTGRGTPLGGPVPTMKIATNTPLARRKPAWIDFNAGQLLAGTPMADLADDLLAHVLAVASGRSQTANERRGFREIALFSDGVTL